MERAAQNIIEIGTRLIEVKAALPHGQFGPWLAVEFKWSERAAQNFMAVARIFESATVADLDIAPKALYLLASPSASELVREEILEQAKAGEKITHAAVKATIEARKPATEKTLIDADTGEIIDNALVETVTV